MAVCSSTKITQDMLTEFNSEGVKFCSPFRPAYTTQVKSIKFWLKKKDGFDTLPAEVQVSVDSATGEGIPYAHQSSVETVEVPAGLDTDGEELTATFDDQFQIVQGNNYGILFYFPHQANAFTIIIAGGKDDTCPWQSGGDVAPLVKADYSAYGWKSYSGNIPAYYQLIAPTGDAIVSCTGATVVTDTTAILNCQVTNIPEGKKVVLRGMQWGENRCLW